MTVTAELFRRLALALPGATEGSHQGHPDFRCEAGVFATLPDPATGMVRVPNELQRTLVARAGGAFWPANGAWGRAGCTMLRLGDVDEATLRDALTAAWQFALASAAARRSKK